MDISKAFDKVWHEVLIFTPQSIVVDVLLDFIGSFLENRFQKFALNVENAEWLPVNAGAPQGFYFRLRKLIFHGK